jgi:hypothetical protein
VAAGGTVNIIDEKIGATKETAKHLSALRKASCKICAECGKNKPPRWEYIIWDLIQGKLPPPSIRDDQLLGGVQCQSQKTRPDVCWVGEDRIVHLEIDEGSHTDREISCELKKLDSANWGFLDSGLRKKHLPTLTIRFNPNEYDGRKIGVKDRCVELVKVVRIFIAGSIQSWDLLRTNVIYMFYHSKAQKHIEAAKNAEESIYVLSVIS